MARDISKVKIEGIVFKKGKDESVEHKSIPGYTPPKQKGKTISGSAKMRAEYKARKKGRKSQTRK